MYSSVHCQYRVHNGCLHQHIFSTTNQLTIPHYESIKIDFVVNDRKIKRDDWILTSSQNDDGIIESLDSQFLVLTPFKTCFCYSRDDLVSNKCQAATHCTCSCILRHATCYTCSCILWHATCYACSCILWHATCYTCSCILWHATCYTCSCILRHATCSCILRQYSLNICRNFEKFLSDFSPQHQINSSSVAVTDS